MQDIAADRIAEPPPLGAGIDTRFILGMGKVGEAVKILLDIHRVLAGDGEPLAAAQAA